jgi:DNA-binding CsgD family transcriptional regulator
MVDSDEELLVEEERRIFWRTAEAANDVVDRYQFFVWLELHVSQMIPHDLALVLFRTSGANQEMRVEVLNSIPLPPPLRADLSNGWSKWWAGIRERLARHDRRADVIPLSSAGQDEYARLQRAGFEELVIHGFDSQSAAGAETLFVFALNRRQVADPRHDSVLFNLDMCLPVLHCAALRAFGGAVAGAASTTVIDLRPIEADARGLTRRQLQILAAVRDAKHNAQIGQMLGISAATVKNHLHIIMRKLHATNRAQAVAEAMARRLIF